MHIIRGILVAIHLCFFHCNYFHVHFIFFLFNLYSDKILGYIFTVASFSYIFAAPFTSMISKVFKKKRYG